VITWGKRISHGRCTTTRFESLKRQFPSVPTYRNMPPPWPRRGKRRELPANPKSSGHPEGGFDSDAYAFQLEQRKDIERHFFGWSHTVHVPMDSQTHEIRTQRQRLFAVGAEAFADNFFAIVRPARNCRTALVAHAVTSRAKSGSVVDKTAARACETGGHPFDHEFRFDVDFDNDKLVPRPQYALQGDSLG